jgi:transitional endoplasmic reticulum ATPase
MDGLEGLKDVLILGATNRPDLLDPALLRPGRFDRVLLISTADEEGRFKTLRIHTAKTPLGEKKEFKEKERETLLRDLAKITEGYTGADLESLAREAAMEALREDLKSPFVKRKHFDKALEKVKPSVTKATIETYRKIELEYLKSAKAAIPHSNSYLG